jgi:hypothetical protein
VERKEKRASCGASEGQKHAVCSGSLRHLGSGLEMTAESQCTAQPCRIRVNGAAQESNLPSVGLPRLTGFEDRCYPERVCSTRIEQASGNACTWGLYRKSLFDSMSAGARVVACRCVPCDAAGARSESVFVTFRVGA